MTRQIVAYQKAFQCTDANGFTSAGLLEVEDFAAFEARVEEPAATAYRGIEVYKAGSGRKAPSCCKR